MTIEQAYIKWVLEISNEQYRGDLTWTKVL